MPISIDMEEKVAPILSVCLIYQRIESVFLAIKANGKMNLTFIIPFHDY